MTKQCPECKDISIDDEAKFCHRDGTQLNELDACNHCGAKFLPHFKFCRKCGLKLGENK
jgi:predicted amidophosphoribosyltransferase